VRASSAAKTLADITDERQLPIGYLAALITLFLFMVGERVFYSQVGVAMISCLTHDGWGCGHDLVFDSRWVGVGP
jgi:hypothetical protein